jgi:Predicted membrane protein
MAADFQQLELFTYANAIAFCVLFALVPFALFVVALLGFLDLTVLWTRDLAPGVGAIVGPSAFGVLDETVRQILVARQGLLADGRIGSDRLGTLERSVRSGRSAQPHLPVERRATAVAPV